MAIAGTLEIQMLANIARLQGDMNKAQSVVGGAMKNIEATVSQAKSVLASLGVGVGVGALAAMAKGVIDAADKFNDLTQSMGISREELAKYQLAAAQSGTSLEGLGKGIKGLTSAFAEHGDELKKAGITATTADGQIRQLADIFSNMPDGLEKTTLATKLFGKSGMELIPMLNMGSAGLAEAAEKSANYAAVMATLAPQADKFNDTMAELGMASKVAGMAMLNNALPALTGIAAAMAEAAHQGGMLKAAWVGLGGIGWEGIFKPLIVLIKGTMASLMDANAAMLRFFGANKDAAYESQRAAKIWGEIAALQDDAAPTIKKAEIDTAAWTAQYKKLIEALGIGKKEIKDTESAYRGLMNALEQKLALDKESTEVDKLMLTLSQLTSEQYAKLTIAELVNLEATAHAVDLKNAEKKAREDAKKAIEEETKVLMAYAEWLEKTKGELNAAISAEDVARKSASDSMEKMLDNIRFETSLIGMSNEQRELEIALRALQVSGLKEEDIAYQALIPRIKEAIAARQAAQHAEDTKKAITEDFKTMWSTVENTGKQVWTILTAGGENMARSIGKAIKASIIDMLYQMTVRKWIINVGTTVSGAMGASGAAASAGASALGSAGSSAATSAFGQSMSSFFGGMYEGASWAITGAVQSLGVSLGSQFIADIGTGMASSFAATMASGSIAQAIGYAIPVVGWVLAAWSIWKALAKDAPPTGTGGADIVAGGTIASGYHEASAGYDPTNNVRMAANALKEFAGVVKSLGGTISGHLGINISQGYGGTWGVTTGSNQANGVMRNANAADAAGVQQEILRSIVLGMQVAADLPMYLKKVFQSIDVSIATTEEITSAIKFAQALKGIHDNLKETRPAFEVVQQASKDLQHTLGTTAKTFREDFLTAIESGNMTPEALAEWQKLAGLIDAVNEAIRNFTATQASLVDHFSTADQKLAAAQKQVADAAAQLGYTGPITAEVIRNLAASLDPTTAAGQAAIAQLNALVPALDQVLAASGGAASGLNDVSAALAEIAQVQNDLNAAIESFKTPAEKVADAWAQINKAAADIGYTGPLTVDVYKNLLAILPPVTAENKEFIESILALGPAFDLIGQQAAQMQNDLTSAISQMTASVTSTLDSFRTPAERVAEAQRQINEAAKHYGITGTITAQMYRDLLASADPATEAGRALIAVLLPLGPAFQTVAQAEEQRIATLKSWQDRLAVASGRTTQRQIDMQRDLEGVTDQALIALIKQYYAQLDANDAAREAAEAQKRFAQAARDAMAQLVQWGQQIKDFLRSLEVGPHAVSPQSALAAAKKQYEDDLRKAQGGDAEAYKRITQSAQTYLDLMKQNYGAGGGYSALLALIKQQLGDLSPVANLDANIEQLKKLEEELKRLNTTSSSINTGTTGVKENTKWIEDVKNNTNSTSTSLAAMTAGGVTFNPNSPMQSVFNAILAANVDMKTFLYTGLKPYLDRYIEQGDLAIRLINEGTNAWLSSIRDTLVDIRTNTSNGADAIGGRVWALHNDINMNGSNGPTTNKLLNDLNKHLGVPGSQPAANVAGGDNVVQLRSEVRDLKVVLARLLERGNEQVATQTKVLVEAVAGGADKQARATVNAQALVVRK